MRKVPTIRLRLAPGEKVYGPYVHGDKARFHIVDENRRTRIKTLELQVNGKRSKSSLKVEPRPIGFRPRMPPPENPKSGGQPTHGMAKTPEWRAWCAARQRCHNPNCSSYANYGGRGIQMCDAWRESFELFYAHIGPKPSPMHSLDRIDNDGHYEPGNVRWATKTEQARNQRRRTGQ